MLLPCNGMIHCNWIQCSRNRVAVELAKAEGVSRNVVYNQLPSNPQPHSADHHKNQNCKRFAKVWLNAVAMWWNDSLHLDTMLPCFQQSRGNGLTNLHHKSHHRERKDAKSKFKIGNIHSQKESLLSLSVAWSVSAKWLRSSRMNFSYLLQCKHPTSQW